MEKYLPITRKNVYAAKKQEMSKAESYEMVRGLLKQQQQISRAKMCPGHIVFTSYDAKDKTQTYDKTPLVLILRVSKSYTLGLNFHWIPMIHRINLIAYINNINNNAKRIKEGKPIEFSYKDVKPLLKSMGYAPCIRLYINARFAKRGVFIPPERLKEVARLKAETFTGGRYSAEQLWAMARRKSQRSKRRKK